MKRLAFTGVSFSSRLRMFPSTPLSVMEPVLNVKKVVWQMIALMTLVPVVAVSLPFGAALTNSRRIWKPSGLVIYDTALPKERLTPAMFESAIEEYYRFLRGGPGSGLISLALVRRVQIVEVHRAHTDYPEYVLRLHTYFNLPFFQRTVGVTGGEPNLYSRDAAPRYYQEF